MCAAEHDVSFSYSRARGLACPQLKRGSLGNAMNDSFTIHSSDDGARFELTRHNRGNLIAELNGRGLQASVLVSSYMFEGFASFFGGLATNWKGWQGERVWNSLEGELTLKAMSDRTGHVHVVVNVRDGAPPRWELSVVVALEAGQLDGLAARAHVFEESVTRAA